MVLTVRKLSFTDRIVCRTARQSDSKFGSVVLGLGESVSSGRLGSQDLQVHHYAVEFA